MNKALLEILVCPVCKGPLNYKNQNQNKKQDKTEELWCRADKLAYPIIDEIPVMLLDQARKLNLEELD